MPTCPACQRPVAVARARCLYCGAPLPAEPPATAQPEPPAEIPARSPRTLVVIEPAAQDMDPPRLAFALGCSSYEASQLLLRGGPQLHRILDEPAAEAEAGRLRLLGLTAVTLPEAELPLRPLLVAGGERLPDGLRLRSEQGPLELAASALLLIVSGPVQRQRQALPARRRVDTSSVHEGWRVHLHRRNEPQPIEIDADNFEPGFAVSGSTRLELAGWLAELGGRVPHDERFRLQPPALAPAEPPPRGSLGMLGRLRAPAAPAPLDPASPARAPGLEPIWLDNTRQFRFYSAWRGLLERRRPSAAAIFEAGPGDDR